jgi:hypothetical protein
VLKTHIINYIKTREVYSAYRQNGYSKRFLSEHEAEILLHKAAKKAFDDEVQEFVPVDSMPRGAPIDNQCGDDNAACDKYPVPHDIQAEY